LRLPAPQPQDAAMVFGVVGLTSSAGISGWVEYLLLRSALQRRIGIVRVERAFYGKLLAAALAAGVISLLALKWLLPGVRGILPLPASWFTVVNGIGSIVIFAAVYLPVTLWLQIPETRRLLRSARGN
jgi:putative peptidoglycan lipid II flippase